MTPPSSMRRFGRLLMFLATFALTLPGCGGGGLSDGTSGEFGVNEGSYSEQDFDYADPNPVGFHPFGRDEHAVLENEEIAVYVPGAQGWVLDGADHGHEPMATLGDPALRLFDAKAGNLDADAAKEWIAVGIDDAHRIHIRAHELQGARALPVDAITLGDATYLNVGLSLGDVDGDKRDEILVSAVHGSISGRTKTPAGGWVRIYDDANGAFRLLRHMPVELAPLHDVRVAAGDLDGDELAEIVVLERHDVTVQARMLDDARAGYALLERKANTGRNAFLPFRVDEDRPNNYYWYHDMDVVIGDFDGDDRGELAFAVVYDSGSPSIMIDCYEDAGAGFAFMNQRLSAGVSGGSDFDPYAVNRRWQLLVGDMDGTGNDELIVPVTYWTHDPDWRVALNHFPFGSDRDRWERSSGLVARGLNQHHTSRTVIVQDELEPGDKAVVAVLDNVRGGIRFYRYGHMENVESEGSGTGPRPLRPIRARYSPTYLGSWEQPVDIRNAYSQRVTPILAGGDFDADSMVLRYVEKIQHLADPMPIVVMAAPPTKADTSQSLGSEVSYARSQGVSRTHTVTSGTTISAEVGVEADFFDKLVGGGVKKTYEESIEEAHGTTQQVVQTIAYSGGPEDDHIIFQGILYLSYVYEITAAPETELVGTKMSFDVPVASRVYKWTLSYFNEAAPEGARIDRAQVLGHTVGDPASYPREDDARMRVANLGGWSSKRATVGQGTRSNSVTIDVTESNTTERSQTITNGVSGEVNIGPFTGGGSMGTSEGWVYSIETSHGTQFRGVVGDISDSGEYAEWSYDFGLVAHPYRSTGGPAFQVIQFWTNPLGLRY